jgi:c(7)-type cytochrome triheme protein
VAACSTSTRQLFFDIPTPSEQELAAKAEKDAAEAATPQQVNGTGSRVSTEETLLPPPAIEAHLSWDKAQQELPESEFGGIDWVAALEQGLVRPRALGDPKAADAAAFKYDFIIEGKKEKFNALFPHSAHTGWLGCQNCHAGLYPFKRNPTSMKEMRKGASCGKCHGEVAFSLKQCKRCHVNM